MHSKSSCRAQSESFSFAMILRYCIVVCCLRGLLVYEVLASTGGSCRSIRAGATARSGRSHAISDYEVRTLEAKIEHSLKKGRTLAETGAIVFAS